MPAEDEPKEEAAVDELKNLTEEEKDEVKEVFEIFDKENNQTIENAMLGTLLRWLKYNPTDNDLKAYVKRFDPHNTGVIKLQSVLTIANEKKLDTDTVDELIEALRLFDNDNDGKITVPELRWAMTKLGDAFEEAQVDEMLKEIDKDNTGFVELLEFARISFNIKEEKPKEPKDAKKGEAKKDAKKKK